VSRAKVIRLFWIGAAATLAAAALAALAPAGTAVALVSPGRALLVVAA
jgi:hypothetical protein